MNAHSDSRDALYIHLCYLTKKAYFFLFKKVNQLHNMLIKSMTEPLLVTHGNRSMKLSTKLNILVLENDGNIAQKFKLILSSLGPPYYIIVKNSITLLRVKIYTKRIVLKVFFYLKYILKAVVSFAKRKI